MTHGIELLSQPWIVRSPGGVDIGYASWRPHNLWADGRGYLVPIGELVSAAACPYIYYSITNPGSARDENLWHIHHNQLDRFVVVYGRALFALSDGTRLQGVVLDGDNPGTLYVPPGVYHCFRTVGFGQPSILLNYPSKVYDPEDEGRVPFDELEVEHPW